MAFERVLVILLVGLAGCGRGPVVETDLSEQQFIDLFVDVFAVSQRYADAPDSLIVHRDVVFQKRGVTRDQVTRFLEARRAHPGAWASVMARLQDRMGEKLVPTPKAFSDLSGARDSLSGPQKNGQRP